MNKDIFKSTLRLLELDKRQTVDNELKAEIYKRFRGVPNDCWERICSKMVDFEDFFPKISTIRKYLVSDGYYKRLNNLRKTKYEEADRRLAGQYSDEDIKENKLKLTEMLKSLRENNMNRLADKIEKRKKTEAKEGKL